MNLQNVEAKAQSISGAISETVASINKAAKRHYLGTAFRVALGLSTLGLADLTLNPAHSPFSGSNAESAQGIDIAHASELVSLKDTSLVDPRVDLGPYAIYQQFPEWVNMQSQGILDHNTGIGLEMHFSRNGSDLPSLTQLKMEDVPKNPQGDFLLPNNTMVTLDGPANEFGRAPLSWWRLPANKSFYLSVGEGEIFIFTPAYLMKTGVDASVLQLIQIDPEPGGIPDQHNNLVWINTGSDPVVALGGFVPGHAIAIAMDAPNSLVAERLLYGQMAWNPNPPHRSTVAIHAINLETGAAGSWLSETKNWPQDREIGILPQGGSFPLEHKFKNYR